MTEIRSPKALETWLFAGREKWGQIIASRIALRVLPFASVSESDWLLLEALNQFRSLFFGWSGGNYSRIDSSAALNAAIRAAAEEGLEPGYYDVAEAAAGAALTNSDACQAARCAEFAFKHAFELEKAPLWRSISDDCDWLNRFTSYHSAVARELSQRALWPGGTPGLWHSHWARHRKALLEISPTYEVWIDWFERRIAGELAAFAIPGDKHIKENRAILRRLAEATDEDFWGKGHEYVNATLKGWLDEARARVAPPPVIAESSAVFEITGSATAELGPLPTPPQEASAIAYGVNEQGRLDRLPNSNQAHLRDVPDQRRAYDDLREAAAELLGEGQRLGHRLQRALDRFLNSLPDGFEDAEAYLVWRDANALRRLHRAHREAAKSSEPDEARLEPVVAEGLGGLLDLYNNFAFADDGLRAKDEARVAPQELASAEAEAKAASPLVEAILANPEIATPDALDDIIADVENAELPADDPYASQVLDQANRNKRNLFAGLISDTWAAFKNTGVVGQAIAGGAAWDGVKIAATTVAGVNYAPLLDFIATNPSLLQHYVAIAFPSFEHLPSLIDQLKSLWAKLRH